MFLRSLNILKSNSFFLFGARGTGKTTLLEAAFNTSEYHLLNLLEDETLKQLQARPDTLSSIVEKENKKWIIIDEVQKVPQLLDQVHNLIEKKKQKFALTGSSARKLKRGGANLLAGRAFVFKLFPLTHIELGDLFNLDDILNFGSLPKIFSFKSDREKRLFLKAYTETYLKEEILIEQLIRNVPPFRKFLEIAAHQDSELISYSNIARDVLVDPKFIANYYSILEDTLLGFFLEPYHTSIRKRQKKSPKFYWFDLGIRRALSGTLDNVITPKSYEYGSLFESFIVNEIYRLLIYSEKSFKLSFIRVDDNFEIDLVLERAGLPTYLIEIKSTDRITEAHTQVVHKLSKQVEKSITLLLSQDKIQKVINGVTCVHWTTGIKELGI